MTTPTREQVVQWAMSVGINKFGLNELAPYPTVDQYAQIITLARSDLEATIAELQQAMELKEADYQFVEAMLHAERDAEQARRIADLDTITEQAAELGSLREHISRIAKYQKDSDWQMMGISIREAADAIAAAPKQEK